MLRCQTVQRKHHFAAHFLRIAHGIGIVVACCLQHKAATMEIHQAGCLADRFLGDRTKQVIFSPSQQGISWAVTSNSLSRQRNFGGFMWGTDIARNFSLIGGAKRFQGKNSHRIPYFFIGNAPSDPDVFIISRDGSAGNKKSPLTGRKQAQK